MADESGTIAEKPMNTALSELSACENLLQTSAWAARWGARASSADTVVLWTPDPTHPLLVCTGGSGEGARTTLRTSVSREEPLARELLRDKAPVLFSRAEFEPRQKTWLPDLPPGAAWVLFLPLEAEGSVAAVLTLLFAARPSPDAIAARVRALIPEAPKSLARSLKAERKTAGMRQAIERLTALYDLSKAFGSTIDLAELDQIIARKAVDFATAEVGSVWLLEPDGEDLLLAETVVNENYEVPGAPASVGSSVAGDVLADRAAVRRNAIQPDDPAAAEENGFAVRSLLAVPLVESDHSIGVLTLVNKRGRNPEFTAEDEELIQDLARQAVRALHNARQHEAQKKVEELDALLTVSREITATLDIDKVMKTIVNGASALISYDRCMIAIMQRGKLRLGSVSGISQLDRKDPKIERAEDLLEWVYFGGSDVTVAQSEDGTIETERLETQEKFRAHFQDTGFRAFYAVILRDEEGRLGVLTFESQSPFLLDEGSRGLLDILVNQATVAVRNAQLYKQVPLAGFWKPLLDKRRRLLDVPKRRRLAWAAAAAAVLLVLLVVPWRLRIAGPARILPGRRAAATAGVEGVVNSVLRREGEAVASGDVIATLRDEQYKAGLEEARSGLAIAESDLSRLQSAGDAAAMFEAQSRRDELRARIALEEDRLARTQIRAPVEGVIVTPRIEERVGQFFARGAELCVIADVRTATAEVAVPEADVARVSVGERVALKLNPYPTRGFAGTVTRVGSHVREEEKDRFVIVEVKVDNPAGLLKTGMLGQAKISTSRVPIIVALLRKPGRYFWNKIWPVLP
ncbi:MAG: GAF domain-containing protein [Acidobacteriota bacterium]